MLIKPSLVSFLVGMVLFAHMRAAQSPATSTTRKRGAKDEGSTLMNLENKILPNLPLPEIPSRLQREITIYVKKGRIRELMKQIFPQYTEVQDEIARLVKEIRQDEKKYEDEGVRQKLISLSREQSVLEQAELNLTTLAIRALVSRLSESLLEPIVFVVRVIDEEREHFPDFAKFPEIKAYQESLSAHFDNEFYKVYQTIREEELKRKKKKGPKESSKRNSSNKKEA